MSGKFNLCGIEIDYQNLVNCFTNVKIVDDRKPLTKEELDQQIEEYQRYGEILKKHKDCNFECENVSDWIGHSLDDYIKHQNECEERYMKQFDNLEFINDWFQCERMHPKYYLVINFDKIPYYADLLGWN